MTSAKKTIKIKRIGVMPVAKVMAFIYGTAFFAIAAMLVLIDIATGSFMDDVALEIGLLVGVPVIYGLVAAVVFAIGAMLYNFAAEKMGGIEIETE